MVNLLPGIQLFSLVDVVLLTLYSWSSADQTFLLVWAGAATLWCAWWWFSPRRPLPSTVGLVIYAIVEASVFGIFLAVVLPGAEPGRAAVLTAFAAGLLAAGGLSKMSVPPAALGFLGTLAAEAALALSQSQLPDLWVPELLLAAFTVALGSLVLGMSKIFDARVSAEEELDRQKTLVSHLFNDFEESASEGLWESDVAGRITMLSPRLRQLFGLTSSDLRGHPLAPWEDIGPVFERRAAFRNLVVPVETEGAPRWWALSGKPLRDAQGQVVGWRGVGSDVTQARQQELEMLRLSRHDALTGLTNRHAFRRLLDEVGTPRDGVHALVLIDIHGFRDVNESRGHAFGDALLQAVAGRLRAEMPPTVEVARLDGDEFALLATVTEAQDDLQPRLDRLMTHLTRPYLLAGARFEAGFRMGTARAPQDAETPDQWLRCADLALRAAKVRGRNQVVAFTGAMMDEFRHRHRLQEDLTGAQDRGEMALAYQPLVDLLSGRTTGFEALLRWTHPTEGPVPPTTFIPLAEENETIIALGRWVLVQACREAQGWPAEVSVSVNVSGVQLRAGNFDTEVAAVLKAEGFDPRRLILEVTESALIQDDDAVGAALTALKARGVRLALDDFGTGYSALSYLQDFPFDKLKIDQSFVRPRDGQDRSVALLGSIVSLARSLGLSTTAEGIEDPHLREVLEGLGCDEGQGNYFSRPVPPEGVRALLSPSPTRS